jgi:peptide/nickel transport system substrate-binding protein
VLDDQTHALYLMWWNRIIPYRSYVKGFRISPSHYINQDLATLWLDR